MGLQGYVGGSEDVRRIRRQEKERETQKKKFEDLKKQQAANTDQAGLRQFNTGTSEAIENAFKNETIGLVTREEFLAKRNTMEERFKEEEKKRRREVDDAVSKEMELNRLKKAKLAAKARLSFVGEDEEEVEEEGGEDEEGAGEGMQMVSKKASQTFGKDPTVQTHFLPDREREENELQLREQLKNEWNERQKAIKNEPLKITYSYWDGTGHRRSITVRKGDTIGEFLQAVRDSLAPEFRELKGLSVSNLMYIKEDLILPQNVSFYDLIVNKARGKSGPLFNFDVHEDIRMVNDARVEKDESHAGKIVDRYWYNRNKHIFPASRWEVYDAEKSFADYSIKG